MIRADFASLESVRTLADEVLSKDDRLDVLLNNAGTVSKRRELTVDGFETTFAVNHLAPFLLTNLLLDRVVASAPARIVTVSSVGHLNGTLDFDDLGFERGFGIMKAYGRSKLANVLFANELARRLPAGVTSNSLHPGGVNTNIWSGAPTWAKPIIALFWRRSFISAEQGGSYLADLAANPALAGVTGSYFDRDREVSPSVGAQDPELARRLWDVSAELVGLPASMRRRSRPEES
jgi:NAD(P)-dependent dehydrogenase (short-subunit alcohol dehydrogenase family)